MSAANPVSPKVIAGTLAAIAAPIVLSVLASVLNWLVTGDGEAWLNELLVGTPAWVPVVVFALVSALSAAVAGYLKTDPLRHPQPVAPVVDAQPVATDPDLSWTPGDESERDL